MDVFTPEKRSEVMSRIRGRDTKPELALRSMLHRLGYRFTVNGPKNKSLPGRPDLVLPKHRTAIFVHDCSIRTCLHLHHILLNRHRILEIAFATEKLLKPGHHAIGNFTLSLQLRGKDPNAIASAAVVIRRDASHRRKRSLEHGVDEYTESLAFHRCASI
jgi:DNA mismatch endonuclease Vsr